LRDITFFPFDSRLGPDGTHDRVWHARDFAHDRQMFLGNGIYPNPSTNLQVVSLFNNMRITVRGGAAWIEGHSYIQGRIRNGRVEGIDITLEAEENTSGVMRIDMVVAELSFLRNRRNIEIRIITGSTTLTRNDDVYQLKLAEIAVNPGTMSIPQSSVTDTRLNSEECGIMYAIVDNMDTTTIFNQYMDYLERKQAEWDAFQANEQLIWQNQTARQESDWQDQTSIQEDDFRRLFEDMKLTFQALETQSFTLIDNNFDNVSRMRGCNRVTTFPGDDILTTITVVTLDFVLATRRTVFNADGSITITIRFNAWENAEGSTAILFTPFTLVATTIFNADGTIREEIR